MSSCFFFFFKMEKKNNDKSLISIKCCYSWKLQWSLVVQLPVLVLAYDSEGCHDHQFLLWKHQDQCLVSVLCKTPNKALKLSTFTKSWLIWKLVIPLNMPLLLMFLQQTVDSLYVIWLLDVVDSLEKTSLCSCNVF